MIRRGKDAAIISTLIEFNTIMSLFVKMGAKNFFDIRTRDEVIRKKYALAWPDDSDNVEYSRVDYWKDSVGYNTLPARDFIAPDVDDFEII